MDEGFYHSMTVDTMHQTSDLALSAIPFPSPVMSQIADVPRADEKCDFLSSPGKGHCGESHQM